MTTVAQSETHRVDVESGRHRRSGREIGDGREAGSGREGVSGRDGGRSDWNGRREWQGRSEWEGRKDCMGGKEGVGGKKELGGKEEGRVLVLSYIMPICLSSWFEVYCVKLEVSMLVHVHFTLSHSFCHFIL